MKIEIKFEAELPKDQKKVNAIILSETLVENHYNLEYQILERLKENICKDERKFITFLLSLIHENGHINELL